MALQVALLVTDARLDGRHEPGRVRADAGCEIVEETLGGGEILFRLGVDEHAEVAKSLQARSQLVERDHTGSIAWQELFEVALQVHVQPHRAYRRGQGDENREEPKQRPVPEGPPRVRAHALRRKRTRPQRPPPAPLVESVCGRPESSAASGCTSVGIARSVTAFRESAHPHAATMAAYELPTSTSMTQW